MSVFQTEAIMDAQNTNSKDAMANLNQFIFILRITVSGKLPERAQWQMARLRNA